MTQKDALNILKTGVNVFLTGPAGSGKTHVLREYLRYLKKNEIPVGVTASTGIAATHMGGVTIHSWAGIGVHDTLSEKEIADIAKKRSVRIKIEAARVLIIDEISMLHHYRFDLINRVLQKIRKSKEPFGGIQLVVCGDFFQLPPVSRVGDPEALFAYHATSWKDAKFVTCYLEEQHRQIDREYVGILNAIRNRSISKGMVDRLRERIFLQDDGYEQVIEDGEWTSQIKPTRLYSHNIDVDTENDRELAHLSGYQSEYQMMLHGNKKMAEALKKSCLAPEILKLKIGAQVMFVKNNWDAGYANGTRGTILECADDYILVQTLDDREIEVSRETWRVEEGEKTIAEIEQYPLRLAWAITIHKSQGMSLDAAHIDLSRSFERGMGYVALSRVRSLAGLTLVGLNNAAFEMDSEAYEYDRYFQQQSRNAEAHLMALSTDELEEQQGNFIHIQK